MKNIYIDTWQILGLVTAVSSIKINSAFFFDEVFCFLSNLHIWVMPATK